jgi:glucose-6-phosphate dehydrogenase assembly protein OpcA
VEEAVTVGPVSEAVARVESELAAFWSTPDVIDGGPVAKARASTMNFVAVGSREDVERLEAQAEDLAETHAGRTLLLTIDGHLPAWELKAEWSATCRRDGEVPICRDRVELTFGALAAERAASVADTLAISDVPVVVEAAPGAPAPFADMLAGICDRLIVDSAELPAPRIAQLIRRSRGPLADRAFVRTFSWRELTARFFDEAKGAWRAIRRVEIARSAGSGQDPAALFLGWLASRLGWTFETRDRARDASGQPVEIALTDGAPAGDPAGRRRIDGVRLWTEHRGVPLALACVRLDEAHGNTVRWTIAGPIIAEHVHPLGYRDEAWVLMKAIDATEGDRVLREASLAAAAWSAL